MPVKRGCKGDTVVKLSDYLTLTQICLDLKSRDKNGLIREMAECLKDAKGMKNFKAFVKDVLKREEVATTGIGGEIAIPHARTDAVDSFVVAFGRSIEGIDFQALDSKPCKLFFMLGTPKDQVPQYLQILAYLTKLFKNNVLCRELLAAGNAEAVLQSFRNVEN